MRLSRAALVASLLAAAGCTSPQPCPSLLEECDGQCVEVQSDRRHCGGCGRACAAADACIAGVCGGVPATSCPLRTGGAFVTIGACRAAVKVWVENGDFIAAALANVGGTGAGVPVLDIRAGGDCDTQWTWRANPSSARFAASAPDPRCDVCPTEVQADLPGYLATTQLWCPTGATVLSVLPR